MAGEIDRVRRTLLAMRVRRGDARSAEELVSEFQGPLLFYLRRLLVQEEDAWDCLQETWISALRGLRRLRNPESLSVFLYRTARNHALAHLRRKRLHIELLEAASALAEFDEADVTFKPEDAQAIRQALDRLPLAPREVLTLFFLDDLAISDVAAVLDIPPGTVKSRLHHAKRQLRAVLEEMGYAGQ